jgi:neurotransmitter:Na+ symporter, NSS family
MSNNTVQWGSRIGVILAVAGSAVGLGNFLRFPGQAAQNGGGAFMIPYFIALLLVGIPLAWAEWSMGRFAGSRNFHSAPGIFASLCRNRWGSFLGVFALVIPMMVFTYYVIIEAWCLGYAWQYLSGSFAQLKTAEDFSAFFASFTGGNEHGDLLNLENSKLLIFVVFCFAFNFFLIYRGLNKGIEKFCVFALPVMIVCAACVLVRVLTLGTPNPELPEQSVAGGLNFMWNPDWSTLLKPKTWLAAAGQIFFSLSVGFGVIIVYSSYLRRNDDLALSGLTASTTNELFEVGLGGMITIPAAFIFLGTAVAAQGTFGLGFNTLPNVFAQMPAGNFFGFLWFLMLFLAAVTSSLSMLQPVGAFFEEGLGVNRNRSTALLLTLGILGSGFVLYYSKSLSALDNIDFWCGTFLIVVLAFMQSVIYAWVWTAERGQAELNRGGLIRVPTFLPFVLRFITPVFLFAILVGAIYNDLGGYVENFEKDPVARMSILLIAGVTLFFLALIGYSIGRWDRLGKFKEIESSDPNIQ